MFKMGINANKKQGPYPVENGHGAYFTIFMCTNYHRSVDCDWK